MLRGNEKDDSDGDDEAGRKRERCLDKNGGGKDEMNKGEVKDDGMGV